MPSDIGRVKLSCKLEFICSINKGKKCCLIDSGIIISSGFGLDIPLATAVMKDQAQVVIFFVVPFPTLQF